MSNLTWPEARALALSGRAIRRAGWSLKWLYFADFNWLLRDTAPPPFARITGRLIAQLGETSPPNRAPIPGARIVYTRGGGGADILAAISDADGAFAFDVDFTGGFSIFALVSFAPNLALDSEVRSILRSSATRGGQALDIGTATLFFRTATTYPAGEAPLTATTFWTHETSAESFTPLAARPPVRVPLNTDFGRNEFAAADWTPEPLDGESLPPLTDAPELALDGSGDAAPLRYLVVTWFGSKVEHLRRTDTSGWDRQYSFRVSLLYSYPALDGELIATRVSPGSGYLIETRETTISYGGGGSTIGAPATEPLDYAFPAEIDITVAAGVITAFENVSVALWTGFDSTDGDGVHTYNSDILQDYAHTP